MHVLKWEETKTVDNFTNSNDIQDIQQVVPHNQKTFLYHIGNPLGIQWIGYPPVYLSQYIYFFILGRSPLKGLISRNLKQLTFDTTFQQVVQLILQNQCQWESWRHKFLDTALFHIGSVWSFMSSLLTKDIYPFEKGGRLTMLKFFWAMCSTKQGWLGRLKNLPHPFVYWETTNQQRIFLPSCVWR